uniref:CUB domain-containing protein n=1 Tax=Cyclopterus lumpus TaxID=8103 RepID=A0A8C3A9Q1_CYCLU
DLKDVTGRCLVSIGRPLDEVIHIKVESGSLNCRKSMFYIIYKMRIFAMSWTIALFSPTGVFENPTTSNTNHTCRVLINAPPAVKIRIQALHIGPVFNATNSQSTYIMIRDMDVLKTNVFKGRQLFQWHSSGNMAEIEFHGDYLHSKGSFRAEYSFFQLSCPTEHPLQPGQTWPRSSRHSC